MSQLKSKGVKKSIAFGMRYEGDNYKEIATKLDTTESTLATYFSREWKDDYEEFVKEQNKQRRTIAMHCLSRSAQMASETLTGLLKAKDDRVKFAAAKEILNRTIGLVAEKQEVSEKNLPKPILVEFLGDDRKENEQNN